MNSKKRFFHLLLACGLAISAPLFAQQDSASAVTPEEVAPDPATGEATMGQKLDAAVEKTKEVSGEAWDKSKEVSGQAWQKTKEVSGSLWEKTKEVSGNAVDATSETASKIGAAAKSGYEAAKKTYRESGEEGDSPNEDAGAAATN